MRKNRQMEVDGLIVDNFAGGGGASLGMRIAFGRDPDIAINHDIDAVRMHEANHPDTLHFCESVWDVDPIVACGGRKVAAAWFSPDCFPKGTLVLTARGYVAIEQVVVGDRVLTHKGRYREVTETSSTEKSLRKIRGHGHPGLKVSSEHPFYVRSRTNVWNNNKRQYDRVLSDPQWANAENLTKKSYWSTPLKFPKLPIPGVFTDGNKGINLEVDERLLWLAGRYVGDGWTRLTNTRAELVIVAGSHERKSLALDLNKWQRKGERAIDGELAWQCREVRTGVQFTTNCRALVNWLRNQFGHGAKSKGIPAWLMAANNSLKTAFLEGYLGADGWNGGLFQEAVTISKSLAFGIKALAVSLGKTVSVYLNETPNNVIEGRIVNASPVYKLRWRHNVSVKQTERDELHEWAPVRSNEETGETQKVYNIGVEQDESYVVEGIVVHNCKHFSRAKGAKPVNKNIRGLAWVVVRWAEKVRPRVIMLENVREFKEWGPLIQQTAMKSGKLWPVVDEDGQPVMVPCPERKGLTFRRWMGRLKNLGYTCEFRELNAADYGAPTNRRRFFMVARCDGQPIVWPEPTHAKPDKNGKVPAGLLPHRTAAECIDWSLPCPSIFDRKKPLAPNTLKRIYNGIRKFVIENPKPFIVGLRGPTGSLEPRGLDKPFDTIMPGKTKHIVSPILERSDTEELDRICAAIQDGGKKFQTPFLAGVGGPSGSGKPVSVDRPSNAVMPQDRRALIAPTLIQMGYGERDGQAPRSLDLNKPLGTVVGTGKHAVVETTIVGPFIAGVGGRQAQTPEVSVTQALSTITAKNDKVIVTPVMVKIGQTGRGDDRSSQPNEPLRTVCTKNEDMLVAPFLVKCQHAYDQFRGQSVEDPLHTITQKHGTALAAAFLTRFNNHTVGSGMDEPTPPTMAGGNHSAEVRAFLVAYYGNEEDGQSLNDPMRTATSKGRFGLVTINDVDYQIVDIGMRMLEPRELARAQGFPDSYILTGSKADQTARIGNSVSPMAAAVIARANMPKLLLEEVAA